MEKVKQQIKADLQSVIDYMDQEDTNNPKAYLNQGLGLYECISTLSGTVLKQQQLINQLNNILTEN